MRQIKVGQIYCHYKGGYYRVINCPKYACNGKYIECLFSDETWYQSLSDGQVWLREDEDFNDVVVSGGEIERFRLVDSDAEIKQAIRDGKINPAICGVQSQESRKLLIVDLDGTVRCPKSDAKFINEPDDQELIPGALDMLQHYQQDGWVIVAATNQGGVAAGKKTLEQCIKEQQITMQLAPQLEAIFYCPDYEGKQLGIIHPNGLKDFGEPEGFSSFRKPGSGMIEFIMHRWFKNRYGDLLHKILFVGDREEDEQAAMSARVPFKWAHEWRSELK